MIIYHQDNIAGFAGGHTVYAFTVLSALQRSVDSATGTAVPVFYMHYQRLRRA